MKLMKRISILLLLLVVCILFCSCGMGKNSLEKNFDAWEEENDPNIAIYDDRKNLVIVNGQTISLEESLGKYYENINQDLIVCVKDNKIYGVHAYNFLNKKNHETVDIYSFDILTSTFEVLYTSEFAPKETGESKEYLSHTKACYNNGRILMYDGARTVSYNIATRAVEELKADDFVEPEVNLSIRPMYDDNGNQDYKSIIIKSDVEERVIDIEYMAQRHPYVQELVDIGIFDGIYGEIDPLRLFFDDSYVVNDKIYFVCRVLDNDGESNGLLFVYDYENDQFTFLHHVFSMDYPKIIVVPNES